jgi:ankyrin repeat protein
MGRNALMYAAMMGHHPVVNNLIAAKADPNVQDRTGRTALRFAIIAGQSAMVSTLLSSGANGAHAEPDAPMSVGKRQPTSRRGPRPGRY